MLRRITQALGRYREGAVHDYPRDIWNKIALDAGKKLDAFSEAVEMDSAIAQSSLKGRVQIHRRLGATQ